MSFADNVRRNTVIKSLKYKILTISFEDRIVHYWE